MNDSILKRFNEWNDRIRIARHDWDTAEKEYHNICYESRQLRGNNCSSGRGRTGKVRKGVLLLKDDDLDVDADTRQKFREKELLKISLNRSLTQALWSSTATIIVRATNDGFISSIKQWTITNIKQTEQRNSNSNVVVNNNSNDDNDNNEITKTKLMINQWDAITENIDTIAESIAIDVQKRQNNDKIKVRKLDRLQETRKHFNNCTGNKRRKLSPHQPPSSTTTTTTTTAVRTTKTPLYRRSRKEVGALHARNECLAAMELHEAMRTVLSTLKIQQSNLLICRAVNRAIGSCCERLRSQQYRRRRRLRRRIVRQQQQLRILAAADVAAAGRNNENENENNDNNEDNNINNGENENNAIDVVDNDNNNNNLDENEETNSSGNDNADSNGDNDNNNDNDDDDDDDDAEKEQQKIDEEWNRTVEAVKVDSVYQWYRKNVGLLPV